ncbi:hypothetical protein BD310DRAFT_924579 [Dichomitus squalens]|uniref:Uncharacterized protein n=1 Tax=Dichomitus squalens TaxID=114155 RepID=A0A4Q9PY79_9APHY|nr:hypothetical protein BD310DRAFT_924579 [Dichomitus squalens]
MSVPVCTIRRSAPTIFSWRLVAFQAVFDRVPSCTQLAQLVIFVDMRLPSPFSACSDGIRRSSCVLLPLPLQSTSLPSLKVFFSRPLVPAARVLEVVQESVSSGAQRDFWGRVWEKAQTDEPRQLLVVAWERMMENFFGKEDKSGGGGGKAGGVGTGSGGGRQDGKDGKD